MRRNSAFFGGLIGGSLAVSVILVAMLLTSARIPQVGAYAVRGQHLESFYDTSAPGVLQNAPDTFCVVNRSGYSDVNPAYWQSQIASWLNDPAGWEAIGTSKVDFQPVECLPTSCTQQVKVCIELWAAADPGFCPGPFRPGACARGRESTQHQIDGHTHWVTRYIHIPVDVWWNNWRCEDTSCEIGQWDDKKRVINHEMGHNLGEDGGHAGPEFGVAGDGGLWDGGYDFNPTSGEVDRFRAHYDGEPARPVAPCIGIPASDRVQVSWFDAAIDETENLAEVWRLATDGKPTGHVLDMQQSAASFAHRVTFISDPRSDVVDPDNHTILWYAKSHVVGGERGIPHPNTLTTPITWTGDNGWPSAPCTLKGDPAGPFGQIQLTWEDSSYDETGFAVYYQYSGDNDGPQSLDPNNWSYRGTLPPDAEAFTDTVPASTGLLTYGRRVCAKVIALKGGLSSFDSNWACVHVPPADFDGDHYNDDVDACPTVPTAWPTPVGDTDCDGFTTLAENFMGTDPNVRCASSSTPNNESLPDRWPFDFNDDQAATILDVSTFSSRFGKPGPNPPYAVRWDFNGDNKITITDVSKYSTAFGKRCT